MAILNFNEDKDVRARGGPKKLQISEDSCYLNRISNINQIVQYQSQVLDFKMSVF